MLKIISRTLTSFGSHIEDLLIHTDGKDPILVKKESKKRQRMKNDFELTLCKIAQEEGLTFGELRSLVSEYYCSQSAEYQEVNKSHYEILLYPPDHIIDTDKISDKTKFDNPQTMFSRDNTYLQALIFIPVIIIPPIIDIGFLPLSIIMVGIFVLFYLALRYFAYKGRMKVKRG